MHELADFVLQSIFCSILNPLRLILSLKAYSQMSFSLLYDIWEYAFNDRGKNVKFWFSCTYL